MKTKVEKILTFCDWVLLIAFIGCGIGCIFVGINTIFSYSEKASAEGGLYVDN